MGLTVPADVPCVSIRYQIAQKLHARTDVPTDDRENGRFRDLIDLLLLKDLVEDDEWPRVREACEEIFALRAKHVWPPTVVVFDGWADPYGALVAELSFPLADVQEAADGVQAIRAHRDGCGAGRDQRHSASIARAVHGQSGAMPTAQVLMFARFSRIVPISGGGLVTSPGYANHQLKRVNQ